MLSINNVREKYPVIVRNESCAVNEKLLVKRPRCECFDEEMSTILEVGDIVTSHCSSRFAVTNFEQYFPTTALESAATSFPFLSETMLYSDLSMIYTGFIRSGKSVRKVSKVR